MIFKKIFLLVLSVFLTILGGCAPSPEPKPPLSIPIKMDKAGQKAFIDFWATPSDSSEKNILMIGVSFVGKNTDVDTDIFREIAPALKVKVTRLDKASKEDINFRYFSISPKSTSLDKKKTASSPSAVTAYGNYFAHHDYYLASIDRKSSGFFRAEIETLEDNPAFKNLSFDFVVAYRLYGGK
ncbi:MAG: hypothetical protein NT086_13300 [Proteobacteria bacterium]|nr:hypothetical protein [Pseudomonadota bacterium]